MIYVDSYEKLKYTDNGVSDGRANLSKLNL